MTGQCYGNVMGTHVPSGHGPGYNGLRVKARSLATCELRVCSDCYVGSNPANQISSC